MPTLDQFESVFRSASKELFRPESIALDSLLVLTDLSEEATDRFIEAEREMLLPLQSEELQWHRLAQPGWENVEAVLARLEELKPDLVLTYRNLQTRAHEHPYSLGTCVDVLTQASPTPVLLLPRPDEDGTPAHRQKLDDVMVLTDHLAGADHLVSYGAAMVTREGTLVLTHIEDDAVFARYLEAISRIPEIDTDLAREQLQRQLLAVPADYIESCRARLADRIARVESVVETGHLLGDLRQLIERYQVDLVVMNTKDADQLAMHGMAYPIAVEFRELPLLML